MKLSVSVPATSANLGPGYDVLGLALSMRLSVVGSIALAWKINYRGDGEGKIPTDDTNLILRAYAQMCTAKKWDVIPLALNVVNPIPLGRGLGSSAAAIVTGMALAQMVNDGGIDRDDLFGYAAEMEGHADNIAPAIFGGLQLIEDHDGQSSARNCQLHKSIKVLLVIPPQEKSTKDMRKTVPEKISDEDLKVTDKALESVLAGLATANPEQLRCCQEDRRHQPYRLQAQPISGAIFDLLAESPELAGAYLSGSGTTVGAWVIQDNPKESIIETLSAGGIKARVLLVRPDNLGVKGTVT